MKVTSISRKTFETLQPLELSRNIRNTEAVIYDFPGKKEDKVFKKLHYKSGAVFGNKLFTLEMLDTYKEYLPPYFYIADSLVTVNGSIEGFTVPKVEGKNLADVLLDKSESVENQLFYLKRVGQILEQLKKIRTSTPLKDIYLNDLHESNLLSYN